MEILIVVVLVLVLLVVDWRLNKIHKELKRHNGFMERSAPPPGRAGG
jgi:hypothetical protein